MEGIIRKNKECRIEFPKKMWENVSEEAQELVRLMTEIDPSKRISSQDALLHRWFKREFKVPTQLDSAILNLKKLAIM